MSRKRATPPDTHLGTYRQKRDFRRTGEPAGQRKVSASGRLFVVQKHAAQSLHYDLRLELGGVLLSWAVPKGPSLDPSEKRLAVQVEDHPVDYGSFEGTIPAGEYGGGAVMLWDRGAWTPRGDARASLSKGRLKFEVTGRKMRGAWTLVRMKGAGSRDWLLIKERDGHARREEDYDLLAESPFSVTSGRTLEEIAAGRPAFEIPGRRARLPQNFRLMEPAASKAVPAGDGWLHEILYNGQRVCGRVEADGVRIESAAGDDLSIRFPSVVDELGAIPAVPAMLDGVLVSLEAEGRTSPALLRQPGSGQAGNVCLIVVDAPFLAGRDLRRLGLAVRKDVLQRVLERRAVRTAALQFGGCVDGAGAHVLEHAVRLGAAGLVSKRAESPYTAGPSRDWRVVRAQAHTKDGGSAPRRADAIRHVSNAARVCGVRLTNPDRVLFPEARVRKLDLAHYYETVAELMLPHVVNRPLSLYRGPRGAEREGFFQKHLGEAGAKHIRASAVRSDEGKEPYVTISGLEGLIELVQLGTLEIHPWGSRADDMERPDRMIFDLDPGPDVTWTQLAESARAMRALLEELKLRAFLKTSGGKGLHLVVPLVRRAGWPTVRGFSQNVAKFMARQFPAHFVATVSKAARRGRVFVDYLRNDRGATCVAAYSTRARSNAHVSAPLDWEELGAEPVTLDTAEMTRRIKGRIADPWREFTACRQSISRQSVGRLDELLRRTP